MRTRFATVVTAAVLAITPMVGFAAQQPSSKTSQTKATAKSSTSEHVTKGTVKSLNDTSMVITRSGKSHAEMAFDLGPSVHREGNVTVGSNVSIRYHESGSKHVATAITVRRST